MAERIQKERVAARSREEQLEDVAISVGNVAAKELKTDIDALLDEIDEVLEVNADEFVKAYVQKGGE